MSCRATQDGWVMVECSDKMWSTGEGNDKPLQYSLLENPMKSIKRLKDRTVKEELPRLAVPNMLLEIRGEITPKRMKSQSQLPVVNVTGDGSKVQCCKVQYFIGTSNVRSMNQGKLEVVKQELARENIDILGGCRLKWTGMNEFNSDDHYIYYCEQEPLRRNGIVIIVNQRV